MKKLIFGLALLSSVSAFAGADACKSVAGSYSCDYQGQAVPLSVIVNSAANKAVLTLDGSSEEYILDGKEHKSTRDDSINVSECKNNEIIVDNYFKGQLKGSVSLLKSATGLTYTMEQARGSVQLNCTKSK